MSAPLNMFCCYAREDQALLNELKKHLALLQNRSQITVWSDTNLNAGIEYQKELDRRLESADVILLLISSDFLASNDCRTEMERALQRHDKGIALVIPILLRPVHFQSAPFARLQIIPTDGRPVTRWPDRDEALHDIVTHLNTVFSQLQSSRSLAPKLDTLSVIATAPNDMASLARTTDLVFPSKETVTLPPPEPIMGSTRNGVPLESPSRHPVRSNKRLSRRLVITGGAGLLLASGGLMWLVASHRSVPLGTRLYTYRGHPGWVNAVAWSPDGSRIVSASQEDGEIRVWHATNGATILTYSYPHPSDAVYAVAWDPSSLRIASGGFDQKVPVWNAANGTTIYIYPGHSGFVNAVAWSPDGMRIASASADQTVQVWNATDGSHPFIYRGHSQAVWVAAWSPDGMRIASGGADKTVRVWDAANGKIAFTCLGHSVTTVAWSPDGKYLASAGYDKTVRVWDADNGNPVLVYPGHSDTVDRVAWSPDGSRIASGSADKTVQIWDAMSGKHPFIYHGHSDEVTGVAWSHDGKYLASSSYDQTVQVWVASEEGWV